MRTIWEHSLDTETYRLIHTARQAANGFFRINNFHLIPYPSKNPISPSAVPLPDLPYTQIPRFWEKVKRIDIKHFPLKVDSKLFKITQELLMEHDLPKPNYKETQKVWRKAEDEIIKTIYQIIPSKKDIIKKIIIHPTIFGTSSSFNHINADEGKIEIFLREDQSIHEITEAILTSLTRDDVYNKYFGLWRESELLVDWLVGDTALSKTLAKHQKPQLYVPTSVSISNLQISDLEKLSGKFYKKLGISAGKGLFKAENGHLVYDSTTIKNLTKRERNILSVLVANNGQVITYDEVSDNIFASDDKFSLEAIAKFVQRLRNKLEKNGISGSHIQTVRSQGYLLRN